MPVLRRLLCLLPCETEIEAVLARIDLEANELEEGCPELEDLETCQP